MSLIQLALSVQIVCTGTGGAAGREFVIDRPVEGRPWRLSYRDREHRRWIRLLLPGASPEVSGETARLSYRNANGGRQVELGVLPGGAVLDVYVDYGLDVNIEPDLDPEIDRMNTNGPLKSLHCRVGPVNP